MNTIFIEENGVYSIDCTNAVWATDRMHKDYQEAGIHINDVDFLIENYIKLHFIMFLSYIYVFCKSKKFSLLIYTLHI